MCIYDKSIITEQTLKRYKPTRLYIKELAGVKYFGKTTKDPYTYHGSGVVWLKRIQKYGTDAIKTLWVSEPYDDPYEIQEIALHFSRENQIVESEQWANCKPEDGLDGGRQTDQTVEVIASKLRGQKRTSEQNLAKSKRQTGVKKSKSWLEKRIGMSYERHKDYTDWEYSAENHWRSDKTKYKFENIKTGETIIAIKSVFSKHIGCNVSRLVLGKRATMLGWRYLGPA